MLYAFRAYFLYLLNATNQHGIHSPFVYQLVTKCFYNTKKRSAYKLINSFRKQLLSNTNYISVSDFGAGSRVFNSNKRKIAAIAKNAGISLKRAQLLHRLISYLQITNVLELGTSVGISTASMAIENKEIAIITVEGCPETSKIAIENFHDFELSNITLINDVFENALPSLLKNKFDLVYIDGNHQRDATIHYFNLLLTTVHNETLFIFDDIHWSKEMEAAWNFIKEHPKVTVTIDTFQWGFVFFRKEQAKENFVVRF